MDSLFCYHIPVYILSVLLYCPSGWVFHFSDIYVFILVGFCCCVTSQCLCTLPVCPAGIWWDFQFLAHWRAAFTATVRSFWVLDPAASEVNIRGEYLKKF